MQIVPKAAKVKNFMAPVKIKNVSLVFIISTKALDLICLTFSFNKCKYENCSIK